MTRAFKDIMRAVIGRYSGPDFRVMRTGIMSDVNARRSAGNSAAKFENFRE